MYRNDLAVARAPLRTGAAFLSVKGKRWGPDTPPIGHRAEMLALSVDRRSLAGS